MWWTKLKQLLRIELHLQKADFPIITVEKLRPAWWKCNSLKGIGHLRELREMKDN